ncbi:MAG: 4-hydroxy-tetrahydrodipicolinate synthase (EC [uncultured Paraburkholderia sp.]|nr:MAG: 4-hydroxy-tetrahydrodipicolinate synthase (EC [uncultured Paraburkholderia sp.]CAH2919830.1 MAG: 4-hydroxy-tetrahydrodipicolinate synthase (EC [uncultured Paraburkholderia sp.]
MPTRALPGSSRSARRANRLRSTTPSRTGVLATILDETRAIARDASLAVPLPVMVGVSGNHTASMHARIEAKR